MAGAGRDSPAQRPWTIRIYWLYSVLIGGTAAIAGIAGGLLFASFFIFGVVLVMATFVYRGSKLAWGVVVGAGLLRLVLEPFSPQSAWLIVVEVIGVALLLAPPSVRFAWGGEIRRASSRQEADAVEVGPVGPVGSQGQAHLDPRIYSDSRRPDGWYVDPEEPARMKFWKAGQGWLGKTRTPRAIRRQWGTQGRENDDQVLPS